MLPARVDRTEMLKNGLMSEANTVDDFIAEGKAIEEAAKTQEHYKRQVVVPVTRVTNVAVPQPSGNEPRRVSMTLTKRSDLKNLDNSPNQKPQIYVSAMNYQCTGVEPRVYPSDQYKDHREPHPP